MARLTRSVAPALAAALIAAACGEPLMVLGDAPGLMRIVLGTVEPSGHANDTVATRLRVTDPRAIAFNETTRILYVADRGSVRQSGGLTTPVARIIEVSPTGRATLLLQGGGCTGNTCLVEPAQMALAPDGALIIADVSGSRIFRYVPGGALTVIAGTGSADVSPDGVSAAGAAISRPAGIAVAADGSIFFSESSSHRVRVIGNDGILGTFAGNGASGSSGDGGPAIAASLHGPAGLTLHNGTLYIADQSSHTIRAVDGGGTIRTVAGVPGVEGFSGDGTAASTARLSWPYAVAVTGGALYITDRVNFRVRVVDLDSGIIRTFAGTGSREFSSSRLTAGATALASPTGIAATLSGLVFIVDSGLGIVWRTSVGFD